MSLRIALLGAGGKMGTRIRSKLAAVPDFSVDCVEIDSTATRTLSEAGIAVRSLPEAVASADVVVLAVPDRVIMQVSREVSEFMVKDLLVIGLDPAAAYAGILPKKKGVAYFICHPCHPMLFDPEISRHCSGDYFGGSAVQDTVCALHEGSEHDYALGERFARTIFSPVRECHRISVDQMAVLEPALVETFAATLLSAIRELQDLVVAQGVPEKAVRSFLLGHLRLELAIIFGFAGFSFSDGAKLAIQRAKSVVLNPNWKENVLQKEEIRRTVRSIVGVDP
jgi:hypothetical protein